MIDAPSMVIRGVIQGEKVEIKTSDWCEIDRHQLDDESARQAAGDAYIGILRERAEREKLLIEAAIEDCDAANAEELLAREKRLPEYLFKQMLKDNPKRRLLKRQLIEADELSRELAALMWALVRRKDALGNLFMSRGREISTPTASDIKRAKDIVLHRKP